MVFHRHQTLEIRAEKQALIVLGAIEATVTDRICRRINTATK